MYPLKFENLYYKKVWGGRDLEKYRDNLPDGKIGETWDIACHKNGMSVVSNGEYKGKRLDELIREQGSELIGTKISKDWFPLLIKLLNPTTKLSVQVHPDDEYAKRVEGDMGKTEVWYILEAFEGAEIIAGLKKGITKEKLQRAIAEGKVEECMNNIPVKKGETYLIKRGLIHTVSNVIVAEIQQNSDSTYRFFDYDRGRELHVEKALDVIDFNLEGKKSEGIKVLKEGYSKTYLSLGKDFSLELYDIESSCTEKSDKERFYAFTSVEGEGEIEYNGNIENINKGDSILIPASLGEYKIKGTIKLLKSYVPDVEKVKNEILESKGILY
ncbi:type I phosphomannose isomerase catalytic subunit [Haloimpatiens sp. FM7315]|uniref:type I phosphomannose isomerase catalytic subunit n=1 Tax=Haloimpatiens sp. FM7315 TaxID=3298609 RepID=UPI0035A29C4B